MGSIAVRFRAGDRLHLWMRPTSGVAVARLSIVLDETLHELAVEGPSRLPLPVAWESPASGDGTIEWDSEAVDLSVAYLFSPSTVTVDGTRVIWAGDESRIDGQRYRFHIRPPFGWMNDPNGMCEVDGVTHIFYQHNPHGRRWDTMHWGHALSRDGVVWVHQPVALYPRDELLRGPDRQGGLFSGSALPRPDGTLRLFYTDRDDRRVPAREWQMTTVLAGTEPAAPATVVLDTHPPVPGYRREDWRDPFVFAGPDGRLKMLVGGADEIGCTVLLYETDDPDGAGGWRFVDVLAREAARRNIPAECPGMIRLDEGDLWLLIFGLIGSRDEPTRRRNLTRAHVGHFDGRRFVRLSKHELDFGTDCYAMQVWRGADGPRGIAWAANWADVSADRNFESAMTLPRRLLWRDGHFLTPPIAAVETLRSGPPVDISADRPMPLLDGQAEIELHLTSGQPFALVLDHPTHELMLTYSGETLEFHYEPPGHRVVPSYRAVCPNLRTLRLFVDVGLVEIYADDGRACCTKRIDSAAPVAAVRFTAATPLRSARMWALRLPAQAASSY